MSVLGVERSANRKTGPMSVTHVSQASCPASCPLLKHGCYAEHGRQGSWTRQLNRTTSAPTPRSLARAEARAIDALSGTKPLRLHVVGDARTNEAARILARAAARYTAKHGQLVWTYTHAWRTVDRRSWGSVSVLASCETQAEVLEARRRGYTAALIVPAHSGHRAWRGRGNVRFVPCPAQTMDNITCKSCKLCARVQPGTAIAFEVHGMGERKAREVIANP